MLNPTQPSERNSFSNLCKAKTRLPLFQAIPGRPKRTSSILSHFSQAKTDFLHSKRFQSPKLTSSIQGQAKTDFLQSKLFQSDQNCLLPFKAITVRPKRTSYIPSHSRPNPLLHRTMLLELRPNVTGH
jgi:hypothetical protein